MISDIRTILLVEDNADDVFFMKRALKAAGLGGVLHIVRDGQQALDYLAGRNEFTDRTAFPHPELMFLDLKLPFRTGFDVLEAMQPLKESSPRVIVLTSSPEKRDVTRANELGASGYLVKPPTGEMIRELLESWKTQAE